MPKRRSSFSDPQPSKTARTTESSESSTADEDTPARYRTLSDLSSIPMEKICEMLWNDYDFTDLMNLRKVSRNCMHEVDKFMMLPNNIPTLLSVKVSTLTRDSFKMEILSRWPYNFIKDEVGIREELDADEGKIYTISIIVDVWDINRLQILNKKMSRYIELLEVNLSCTYFDALEILLDGTIIDSVTINNVFRKANPFILSLLWTHNVRHFEGKFEEKSYDEDFIQELITMESCRLITSHVTSDQFLSMTNTKVAKLMREKKRNGYDSQVNDFDLKEFSTSWKVKSIGWY